MRAEIIAIGDEMTSGQRLDTNTPWLAQRLNELGAPVVFHTTVADDLEANVRVFREACERADLVVSTGGLGPTADDLTRFALADMLGVELVRDEAALAHIQALFARRKREMPESNLVQAMFPRGCRVIPNPNGSAPGIDLSVPRAGREAARVFSLPGVPAEMKEMWEATVVPAIRATAGTGKVISHHRVKCFGVGESDLESMLPDLIRRGRQPTVGITVSDATITLRITAEGETAAAARAAMQSTIETIHACLGTIAFGEEDDELQEAVVRLLREQKRKLAVWECGTGGLIAHWLRNCDPLGEIVEWGLVAPNRFGDHPLSEPGVIEELMRGQPVGDDGCNLFAGPFPEVGSPGDPPGSFTAAVRIGNRLMTKSWPFTGHPDILKPKAAKQALNLLRLGLHAGTGREGWRLLRG
jgi:nicotinamide-nucleotide amidase